MDLQLKQKTYAVGGATSGLGRAIAERIIEEGGKVIGIARGQEKLDAMATEFGDKFLPYKADLTDASSVQSLSSFLIERNIDGCVINAGGPPTGRVEELKMEDWDAAYASTLRWKIQLTNALLPSLKAKSVSKNLRSVYGRSTKEPSEC